MTKHTIQFIKNKMFVNGVMVKEYSKNRSLKMKREEFIKRHLTIGNEVSGTGVDDLKTLIISEVKEKDDFILECAKAVGIEIDILGFDGIQLTPDDFSSAMEEKENLCVFRLNKSLVEETINKIDNAILDIPTKTTEQIKYQRKCFNAIKAIRRNNE